MSKFRKKPVVIEAWPVRNIVGLAAHGWSRMPQCIKDAYEGGGWVFRADGISIPTIEGTMRANMGDMLIRGVKGEFYPCNPDIFEATYEPAD